MRSPVLLSLLTALLTFACGTLPQTHYYTIGRPVNQEGVPLPRGTGLTIGVPQFEAEGIYARDNLLYRMGNYEIAADYYRRWGIPPQKMVAEATIDYLRASGVFADVVRLPSMSDVDLILVGRILRFEQVPDQVGSSARVDFEFVLQDSERHSILWRREVSEITPVGALPSAEAIVAALESSVHSCLKQATEAVAELAAKLSSAK